MVSHPKFVSHSKSLNEMRTYQNKTLKIGFIVTPNSKVNIFSRLTYTALCI